MIPSHILALFIAQVISSLNIVASRAAFAKNKKRLNPLTFAIWRTVLSLIALYALRIILLRHRKPSPSENNNINNNGNNGVIDETHSSPVSPTKTTTSFPPAISDSDDGVDHSPSSSPPPSSSSPSSLPMKTPEKFDLLASANSLTSAMSSANFSMFFSASAPAPAHPPVETIVRVVLLGSLVLTLQFVCWFYGVAMTNAIAMAGMMSMVPALTMTFGYLLGLEQQISGEKIFAAALVVVGNLIMAQVFSFSHDGGVGGNPADTAAAVAQKHRHNAHVLFHHGVDFEKPPMPTAAVGATQQDQHSSQNQYFLGVFILFLAFSLWALYLLGQRKLVEKMHIFDFLFYLYLSILAGLLFVCVLVPDDGDNVFRQAIRGELDLLAWFAVFYSVVHSIGTYALIGYGSAVAQSSLLPAIFAALQPIFVALEAVAFLGESITNETIIGGAIVLCGVAASLVAIARQEKPAERTV